VNFLALRLNLSNSLQVSRQSIKLNFSWIYSTK
jgi:hypothetical protein